MIEITNEIQTYVFASYLGQKLQFEKQVLNGYLLDQISTGNLNGEKLMLKPLSAITDEDAIGITETVFEKKDKEDTNWQIKYGLNYLVNYKNREREMVYCVCQFLQSKGYDLPQYLLAGKTLQEAGLAIYE